MMPAPELHPGDRVLVTRLDYLGDVVLSLPLVDALRARWPGLEVDYLTRTPAADLLFRDARFARVWTQTNGARATASLVRALRARRYRAVIDLYSNPRSAWLAWSTGARVRVGGNRRGRRRLYTHPVVVSREVRRVTDVFVRYGIPLGLDAGQPASRPSLVIHRDEAAAADELLARHAGGAEAASRRRIGVHPGGKWSVKRWPTEKFVELIRILEHEMDGSVVVFTGPGERDATERVRALASGRAVFLDVLPIRTAAAVISRLDAMVACDGGIMHVAAAVGTPTVGIFGSSEPAVWFPYAGAGPYRAAYIDVECRPCHRHECPLGHTRCLNELSAEAVAGCVRAAMAQAEVSP
ncbi:MAG TPA: glycosyltransferase family 9 protein [Candidatus Krumholzibacteria bacterium]|nr:glycosyltransferase family 9 protein [Candidatus Krumholzibacteria bacterium]